MIEETELVTRLCYPTYLVIACMRSVVNLDGPLRYHPGDHASGGVGTSALT